MRELLKLFLQFLAVALCSIPATAVYFLLVWLATSSGVANLISLAVGFGCAYLSWRAIGKAIPSDIAATNPASSVISLDKVRATQQIVIQTNTNTLLTAGRLAASIVVVFGTHSIASTAPFSVADHQCEASGNVMLRIADA
jgi:hypothetical protein